MTREQTLELQKLGALGLAVAAVVGLAGVFGQRLFSHAAGDEADIVTILKTAERKGLEIEVSPGHPLVGVTLMYQRLQVSVSGETATVSSTLDFTGVYARQTAVSSLGFEEIEFTRRSGHWEPVSSLAPRLVRTVAALTLRSQALNETRVSLDAQGAMTVVPRERSVPAAALAKSVRLPDTSADGGVSGFFTVSRADLTLLEALTMRHAPTRWLIRGEREAIVVTEEAREVGATRDAPFDREVTRQFELRPSGAGTFFFFEPGGI